MASCLLQYHRHRFWLLSLVVILLFISITLIRRRSPALFLTESDVIHFTPEQKSFPARIPRLIHQTWKNTNIPLRWNSSVQSVRELNAGKFEYRLWTDDDVHRFVRDKEPELYAATFSKYSYDIQRVDAFRYVLLYHLGGIYIDMDAGCSQSLDTVLDILEALDPHAKHLAALPATHPMGLSNDFMISTAGHPYFGQLISRLSLYDHYYLVYYLTVMLSTGPLFVTINERLFASSSRTATVRIIEEKVYAEVFLWFAGGNSWHGRDAQIISYMYESYFFLPVLLLLLSVSIYLYIRRHRHACTFVYSQTL